MLEVIVFLFCLPVIYIVISLLFRFFAHFTQNLRDGSGFGCLLTAVILIATFAIAIGMTHLSAHSGHKAARPDYSVHR